MGAVCGDWTTSEDLIEVFESLAVEFVAAAAGDTV
jgi:hypothetical protein